MSIIYDALKKVEERRGLNINSATFLDNTQLKAQNHFIASSVQYRHWLVLFLLLIAVAWRMHLAMNYITSETKKEVKLPEGKVIDKARESAAAHRDGLSMVNIPKATDTNTISSSLNLEGIIYDEYSPAVIINGKVLRKKERIDTFEVIDITPATVELLNVKDNTKLTLSF